MTDEKLEKISASDLRIEKLCVGHSDIIKTFETDTKELKEFLIEDAISNQESGISKTYLFFFNPENKLVGYMTILTDAVRIHGTKKGKEFVDMGIHYKTLPAIKIGRMCVHHNFVRRNIGKHMMHFAMRMFIDISEKIGCRFIFLDAKTENRAIDFYKSFGFEILRDREKGTIPMYRDMIEILEYYKEQKRKADVAKTGK